MTSFFNEDDTIHNKLDKIETYVPDSAVKKQRSLITSLIALKDSKDLELKHTKIIATILINTLGHYANDRKMRLLLESAISTYSKKFAEENETNSKIRSGFVLLFCKCLLSKIKSWKSNSSLSLLLPITALRWTCIIMKNAADVIAENKIASKIITAQFQLLEIIANNSVGSTHNAIFKHFTISVCSLSPAHKKLYNTVLEKQGNKTALGLLSPLFNNDDSFAKQFCAALLECKAQPPQATIDSYLTFINQISKEQFKNIILPALNRYLVRTPEIIMPTVALLFKEISLDLGDFTKEILSSLTSNFKTTNDELRCHTVAAATSLYTANSDLSKRELVAVAVLNFAKGGAVASRIAAYNCLQQISESKGDTPNILGKIIGFASSEASVAVKTSALDCVLQWVVKRGDSLAKDAALKDLTKLISSGINAAHSVQCYKLAFALVNSSPASLSGLKDTLTKLAKSKSQKQEDRAKALCAMSLLTKIATLDKTVKLDALWKTFVGDDTFISSQVFITKLDVDQQDMMLKFFGIVFSSFSAALSKSTTVFQAIIFLAMQENAKIRKNTKNMIEAALSTYPELSNKLLNTLVSLFKDDEFVADLTPTKSQSLCSVLRASTSSSTAFSKSDFNLVALLIHFPALYIGQPTTKKIKNSNKLWNTVLKQLQISPTQLEYKQLCQFLITSDIGLQFKMTSVGNNFSIAASYCIARLLHVEAVTISEHSSHPIVSQAVVDYLQRSLQITDIEALTDRQVAIYNTPQHEVYDTEALQKQIQELVNANAKPSGKGNRGKMSKEDAKWEANLRSKLNEKKGVNQKVEDKVKSKLLAEEAKVRESVSSTVSTITMALYLLSTCCKISLSSSFSLFPASIKLIRPLFKYQIIANEVADCYHDMWNCLSGIDTYTRWTSETFISYLYYLQLKEEDEPDKMADILDKNALSSKLLPKLLQICKINNRFGGACFSLLYPILEDAIINAKSFVNQGIALKLLEAHLPPFKQTCSLDTTCNYPVEAMIKTLLVLLEFNQPQLLERCSAALVSLCTVLPFEQKDVILDGMLLSVPTTRKACIIGLSKMQFVQQEQMCPEAVVRLMIASNDVDDSNAELADEVTSNYFEASSLVHDTLFPLLYAFLGYNKLDKQSSKVIRVMVGEALMDAVAVQEEMWSECRESVLRHLFETYNDNLPKLVIQTGVRQPEKLPDIGWPARSGIALALQSLSKDAFFTSEELIMASFNFLLKSKALVDEKLCVREEMREAGISIIKENGAEFIAQLQTVFDAYLAADISSEDAALRRESVVVFIGTLAKHLDKQDPKLLEIIDNLIEASIDTPSESVQLEISNCVSPLVTRMKTESVKFVAQLLERLKSCETSQQRKGAAFALAGVVKGLGIACIKKLGITDSLNQMVENRESIGAREAALYAYECFSIRLGRLFEPYVLYILEQLLKAFGDGNVDVRNAAQGAARAIMGKLTGHGVKLVQPAVSRSLEARNWRTKVAAIELLGSMAFCAPKQLSACLPTIVPQLVTLLADTHQKVLRAASSALSHISSVIRNPEIQTHSKIILKALVDPNQYTDAALEALIHTNFVHIIDAPSLALIIPILQRGLESRTNSVKRKAATIVGNMANLTQHTDLAPHLPFLLPPLKEMLGDSIPETRAVCSSALKSLTKGMGDEKLNLIPWLVEGLKSPVGSVERSGAAQGLSQVLSVLNIERFEAVLPQVLNNADSVDTNAREGAIGLFVYLPKAMGEPLIAYMPQILPVILEGIADDAETVRSVAMRAGESVVNEYALSSVSLLLPPLESGLFSENWRIRQSSVQLLGDLLVKLSDPESSVTLSEEEKRLNCKKLDEVLDDSRRISVLTALYMVRSDVSPVVRQKAHLIWKSVVANTPKTLNEILPNLMTKVVDLLGSPNADKRSVASRTLGDLVGKMVEKVLPLAVEILHKNIKHEDSQTREGACLSLKEIVNSAPKHQIQEILDSILDALKAGLCDEEQDVRLAAGESFDRLYATQGNRILEFIIPSLLEDLQDPEKAPIALLGLKEILDVRASVVLPNLIPELTFPPLTTSKCRAIAIIAEVSGKGLYRNLPSILTVLAPEISTNDEARKATEAIVVAIEDDGLPIFMNTLTKLISSSDAKLRLGAALSFNIFAANSKINYEDCVPQIIINLMSRFNDSDQEVLQASWDALSTALSKVNKNKLPTFIADVRFSVKELTNELQRDITLEEKVLPAFCLKKGLSPFLPMFIQGVRYGSPEVRQEAAEGLGEIMKITSAIALKPFVAMITGPLIRVIGDKFPSVVKTTILKTMGILLDRGGMNCKSFISTLQPTFVKSLNDTSEFVREAALNNLKLLFAFPTVRVDQLVKDLLNNAKSSSNNAESAGICCAMLDALSETLLAVGKKASKKSVTSLYCTISTFYTGQENNDSLSEELALDVLTSATKTAGILFQFLSDDEKNTLVTDHFDTASDDQCQTLLLSSVIEYSAAALFSSGKYDDIIVNRLEAAENSLTVITTLINNPACASFVTNKAMDRVVSCLCSLMDSNVSTTKVKSIKAAKQFAKHFSKESEKYLKDLIPILINKLKEKSMVVKFATERALVHLLLPHSTTERVTLCASFLDKTKAHYLNDISNRILAKLPADSDDEQDE